MKPANDGRAEQGDAAVRRPMVRVTLNGTTLAESDRTVVVEGNRYFPTSSVKWEFFKENEEHTVCHWKGVASYYDVAAGGSSVQNAAWTYHTPSAAAQQIVEHVAFYGDRVKIELHRMHR